MLLLVEIALAACSGGGYESAVENLRNKLGNPQGDPQAGADFYKGASATAIYLFTSEADTDLEKYGSTAKVSIHEYHHLLQQGFLHGSITSTQPMGGVVGVNDDERFQVKDYGNVGALWSTHVKGVMDGLPPSIKLFDLPTYILLIPNEVGGIGEGLEAAISELETLLWPTDCAGVDFENRWYQFENGALAEGEAEFYAAGVYMAPGANTWNDDAANNLRWDGAADWASRVSDNENSMQTSPGKQLYHLPLSFPNQDEFEKLEKSGWRQNPVGEICYTYLKTVWRPETTQQDLWKMNIESYSESSFHKGFHSAFNSTWKDFVCQLETHYDIARKNDTCADNADDNDEGQNATMLIIIAILSAICVAVVFTALAFKFNACGMNANRKIDQLETNQDGGLSAPPIFL